MLAKLATLFLLAMVLLALVTARPRRGDKAFDKRGRWARLFRRGPRPKG